MVQNWGVVQQKLSWARETSSDDGMHQMALPPILPPGKNSSSQILRLCAQWEHTLDSLPARVDSDTHTIHRQTPMPHVYITWTAVWWYMCIKNMCQYRVAQTWRWLPPQGCLCRSAGAFQQSWQYPAAGNPTGIAYRPHSGINFIVDIRLLIL